MMATTKTSRPEFLHPTTTPGALDLGISDGQNTRIRPSCSCMTCGCSQKDPRLLSCSLADIPELGDRGCFGATRISRHGRCTKGKGRGGLGRDQVRFPRRQTFHRYKYREEEEAEYGKGFDRARLQ